MRYARKYCELNNEYAQYHVHPSKINEATASAHDPENELVQAWRQETAGLQDIQLFLEYPRPWGMKDVMTSQMKWSSRVLALNGARETPRATSPGDHSRKQN